MRKSRSKIILSPFHFLHVFFAIIAQISVPSFSIAQPNSILFCSSAADTPFLRSEGITEQAGDFRLICKGGIPGSTELANVEIFFNANITNRIVNNNETDVFLFIGEPTAPVLGTNMFQGRIVTPNSIVFLAVPFTDSTTPVTYRISNARVDVTSLAASLGPKATPLISFVSATASRGSIPIDQPQRTAGYVVPSQNLQLQRASNFPLPGVPGPGGDSLPAMTFSIIGGDNTQLVTSTSAANGVVSFTMGLSESFANSFRRRNVATTSATPAAIGDQAVLGNNYGTESGYYNSALPSAGNVNQGGLATQGTRLMLRFNNIPQGVRLYATVNQAGASTGSAKARLITTDASGNGLFNAVAATTTASLFFSPIGIAPLTNTNGSATAVYEVTDSDPAAIESLVFGILAAYITPTTATVTPTVQIGPISVSNVADATSPIPRFGVAAPTSTSSTCTGYCLNAPESITFNYTVGGPLPAPIVLPITSTLAPLPYSAQAISSGFFDASPARNNWLTISHPGSTSQGLTLDGTTPGQVAVSVNPIGFSPGQYPAFITLSRSDGFFIYRRVFVLLNVLPAASSSSGTLDCNGTGQIPPLSRFPGMAEKQGDVMLVCAPPATGAVDVTTNVKVSLNTFVNSRVNGGTSDALLLVNEPNPPNPVTAPQAVYRGEQFSSNSLLFRNVVIPASASNPVILRITNLFADTSRLGLSGMLIPTFVKSYLSVPGVSIQGPTVTTGYIQSGQTFTLRDGSNAAASDMRFLANQTGGPAGIPISHLLNFREGYSSAFLKRNVATSAANPFSVANQAFPGAIYNTETGFYFAGFPTTSGFNTAGLATQGTRLMAKFNNVPSGVSLYVTTQNIAGSSPGITARLTQSDLLGGGVYNPVTSTISTSFSGSAVTLSQVQLSGGSGIAVWEILGSDPLNQEDARFGVVAVYDSPQTVAATVTGLLAPLSQVNAADAFSPMPRFASNPSQSTCIELDCLRNVPSSITLTTTGSTSVSRSISFDDNGQPTTFTVQTSGASWLRLNTFGGVTPASLVITADPALLAFGNYSGSVTIRTDTTSYTVNITFQVVQPTPVVVTPPPPFVPFLELTPARIAVQAVAGGASLSQQLRVSGDSGASFNATSNSSWLRVSPGSGQVPAQLSLTIVPTGLAAGEYLGTVLVTTIGGASATAEVRLSVIEPPQLLPSPASLIFKSSDGAESQTLYVTARGRQLNYSAAVTTEGGSWLAVTPNSGQTPVNLQVKVNSAGLEPGTYKGAVVLNSTDITTPTITLPVTFEVGAPKPMIGSVLNGASLAAGPIAPGMLVAIKGTNLGPAASAAPVRVLFDGIAAPLVSGEQGQINAMVPYATAVRASSSVVVEISASNSSAPFVVPVAASAPSIFTADSSGKGAAAALNTDQSFNSVANPAPADSIVTIFATGAGLLTPASKDGTVAADPVATPLLPVAATIGGLRATIEYVGNAPGLVSGILQINLRVPSTLSGNLEAPLVITVGSATSPGGVTVAVKPAGVK